jgi:hypothetical protein
MDLLVQVRLERARRQRNLRLAARVIYNELIEYGNPAQRFPRPTGRTRASLPQPAALTAAQTTSPKGWPNDGMGGLRVTNPESAAINPWVSR